MIYGIGTDIVQISRIEEALARGGVAFAEKILGPDELAQYHARRDRNDARGVRFLATRFSAKEAFSKAIGLGLRMPMTWRSAQMLNAPSGKPVIELHTGRYAEAHGAELAFELDRIKAGARFGVARGLKVNAGHGLHYTNVQAIAAIGDIGELNIGHALVSHALFAGFENAVREMKAIMTAARLGTTSGQAQHG